MVISIFLFILHLRTYFGFVLRGSITFSVSFALVFRQALIIFRISCVMFARFYNLGGRGGRVPCGVELDDILIYSEGKDNSLRATQLAISIFEFAGFKINFNKSVIAATQVIDYLGYTLDARKQCFGIYKNKLVICKLILKALSLLNSVCRKLMEQLLGFFNFIFIIVPIV